jgi:group II intron reverse transcriptase/maturase/CRISPR-associated endonuclease Cas1
MSIDWKYALDALDLQLMTVSLKLRPGSPGSASEESSPVQFPFFHNAIVHSLMKEVTHASAPVASVPFRTQAVGPASQDSIPAGLIPCSVESGHVSFVTGDLYKLGITLVPRFSPPASSVAGALQSLGNSPSRAADGIQLAGNFEVNLIESLSPPTSEEFERQFVWLVSQTHTTISLYSPFHGKSLSGSGYISADSFDLPAWLNAVHWRAFALSRGRRPDLSNPDECPPPLQEMALSASSLFDVAIPKRHPKLGGRPYEIPGVIGSFTLTGVPDPWWYWLLLCQYLHAGEGTGWGLGRFRIDSPEFHERFHPVGTLLDKLIDPVCLELAKQHIDEFQILKPDSLPLTADPETDLLQLASSIRAGTYIPAPLRGFEINQHGKIRALAVAGHADRILQRAATDVLTPIFESLFNQCSFGYRHGRSRTDAARVISQAWNDGFRYALAADITAFFDHVEWNRLFAKLDALFPDEPLVALVRRWVASDVRYQGQLIHRSQGLPLGISISPLLANLYLDDLDDDLELQGFRLVRYADDFVVLTKDIDSAQRAQSASAAVLHRLGLELNPDKTRIISLADGFTYLGYLFCRSLVVDSNPSGHPETSTSVAPIIKSTWISRLTPAQWYAITPRGILRATTGLPLPIPTLPIPATAPAFSPANLVESTRTAQEDATVMPLEILGSRPTPPQPLAPVVQAVIPPSLPLEEPEAAPVQSRWGLYVVGRNTGISVRYNSLSILREGEQPVSIPVENVSHVVSIGSGRVSSPVLLALGERGIPVFFCTRSGDLVGVYHPHGVSRAQEDYRLWLAQSAAAQNAEIRLAFARPILSAKLDRQMETLSRFATPNQQTRASQIQQLAACIPTAPSIDALLGLEGSASRILFDGIQDQLLGLTRDWPFTHRERRPPPDPVNALLSFGYTLLYIHCATALWTAGLLPQIGLLHALKPGHLALASDLVEEFRHEVDRLVVRLINRREIRAEHFLHGAESDAGACRLTDDGRRVFILAMDGVLQGQSGTQDINDPSDTPARRPAIRRMERQALCIRDFLAGRSPAYRASSC